MPYWKISYSLKNKQLFSDDEALSEIEFSLMEAGADGVYAENNGLVQVCINTFSSKDAHFFASQNTDPFFDSYTLEEIPETNWTQASKDLLEPIEIGRLKVIPVTSSDAVLSQYSDGASNKETLFIIPGMGFGTGHHATTKTVISFLQSDEVMQVISDLQKSAIHPMILDFGTGSGILAIACKKIFPQCSIIAVDNDKDAIENAKENAGLNNIANITFQVGDQPCFSSDIIIANIYAELLQQFEKDFYANLSSVGILIISGIMQEKSGLIDSSFLSTRWIPIESKIERGWMTRMYRKRK
jgi:ribosomal protein L11 methyltransferase